MKKTIGILLTVLLAVSMLPLMGFAASEEIDGDEYFYKVVNGKATITEYFGYGGDITLPATLGGYPVTAIGEQAFISYGLDWGVPITGVIIPEGVTSIGDMAFAYSEKLTSVTIPGSVTNIIHGAFYHCTSLKKVTIPNGVKTIGSSAFADCKKLDSVTISDSVTTIEHTAFHGSDALKCITIPKTVTTIGGAAFGNGFERGSIIWNFKVRCYKGTAGQAYAEERKLAYDLLDGTSSENFVRVFDNLFRMLSLLFVKHY